MKFSTLSCSVRMELAALSVFLLLACAGLGAQARVAAGGVPPLDLAGSMRPIPATAAFSDPGYYVWCGTMIRGGDGRYHLYYSRWKLSDGFQSWVTRSEVAHAVGDSPEGPFVFHDVALPARGARFWDGLVTHNPMIHRFGGKYYLYYMGDTGDGVVMRDLNWGMRNQQRVGVAVADDPNGPWKRFDKPLIDVSADPSAPDSLCTNNPSLTQGRDGRYYLLYKAVGREKPLPFGGPVVHLMAVSDSPTGPFKKDPTPLLTVPGNNFPFEDPFLWFDAQRDLYFVILKDNKGIVSGLGHSSLILYESKDATHWKASEHLLVSDLKLNWEGGRTQKVDNLERPQLSFDKAGNPIALIVAIRVGEQPTFNVRIPLASGAVLEKPALRK
jgi:hypothetical protein